MTVISPTQQAWINLTNLKMVCYFPQAHSWQYQWSSWNGSVYPADFAKIAALNANAVNVRVDVTSFGYPTPDATMRSRLAMVVSFAAAAGLKVVLTCFDNFTTYTDISGSESWLSAVLTPYANDPRIAFIHLRNEVDPTNTNEMTWAKSLVPYAKTIVGTVPVSVSKPDTGGYASFESLAAALSPVVPDFWDWHWYPTSVDGLLWPMLNDVIGSIHPNYLHIGETGSSTFNTYGAQLNGIPQTTTSMNAYQEYWVRVMAQACLEFGLNFHVWMLYDVDPVGAPNEGNDYAYAYGFYTSTGVIKAAGTTLAALWAGGAISQDFNGGMEAGVDDGSGSFVPALWHVATDGSNTGTLLWDQTTAHTGSASMKFTATTGTPAIWISPVSSHVTPGHTATVTCYAKGASSTGSNTLNIDCYSLTGTFVSQITSNAVPSGTTGWAQLTATGTVAANAAYARIYLKAGNNSGSVWFDDVTWAKT